MIVVAVVGLDWQEQCLLAVAYEIEMDRKKLDCSVPMQVIKIGQAGEIRVHLLLKKSLPIANKSGSSVHFKSSNKG
jgi:hypothetical protein